MGDMRTSDCFHGNNHGGFRHSPNLSLGPRKGEHAEDDDRWDVKNGSKI